MFQTQTTIHEVENIKCVHKQLMCSRNKWVHKQVEEVSDTKEAYTVEITADEYQSLKK